MITHSQKIKWIVPFVILFALLGLLWRELFYAKPNELPSALVGEPIPHFSLPRLHEPTLQFTHLDLKGRVSLLTVWASWCYACTYEAPMLMKIKDEYHVPIYSIDYKDDPSDAIAWLKKYGNPFEITGTDQTGDVAIDLGVYGTPETFVITAEGKIIYRHVGVITQTVWDESLYPIIKQYQGEN